jgi:hypothetical protein
LISKSSLGVKSMNLVGMVNNFLIEYLKIIIFCKFIIFNKHTE